LRETTRRPPTLLLDAGLALGLAVATVVAIQVRPQQGADPDALAYGLVLTIAALVLVRRRWPVAVLLASAAILQVYNLLDYPGLVPRCRSRWRWPRRGPLAIEYGRSR
jgi:hypothetical protein